jgi:hypothetical protein
MIIPSLDSLALRDFIVYPSTISDTPAIALVDMDADLNFDQDGMFQVIKQSIPNFLNE